MKGNGLTANEVEERCRGVLGGAVKDPVRESSVTKPWRSVWKVVLAVVALAGMLLHGAMKLVSANGVGTTDAAAVYYRHVTQEPAPNDSCQVLSSGIPLSPCSPSPLSTPVLAVLLVESGGQTPGKGNCTINWITS